MTSAENRSCARACAARPRAWRRGSSWIRASSAWASAATSPAGFIVEYSLGANPLLHDLVEEDFLVKDGMIEVPERPGLGVTVREGFLKQHTVAA